jgi:hypothetical protein
MTWDHLIEGVDPCDNEERIRLKERMRQNSAVSLMEKESPTKEKFSKGHRRTTSAAPRIESEKNKKKEEETNYCQIQKTSTAQGTDDLNGITIESISVKGNQKASTLININNETEASAPPAEDNTALLTKENGTQAMEKSLEDKNDNVKDPPKNRNRFLGGSLTLSFLSSKLFSIA